jgi:nicotinate-nucleotide pyrophosphorylase (carboxylating)
LDNFDAAEIARAVAMNAGRAKLEVSGGLRLENARQLALLGVDYLAVGALTHSAPNLDIGADFILNAQS